ncbi:helix-turn-helix transcriptional regulator [Nocardia alni]|uniref:helix-turn-helix transcriptional regulator n=1 Tax=Nocardia alni TaxID=2815723 RepID=UPI001C227EBB|nr:helix-turn-helix transcriptional regulator [Nocardia alni]
MSDNELGAFLRSRREALRPDDVGLPPGNRRRTPGLRRSELATLAGVSMEYLARLEQGRDQHPSRQVIGALAEALRLSPNDQHELRRLVKAARGIQLPAEQCTAAEPPSTEIRPTIRTLLNRLEPTPAVVVNRLTDVLAHTEGFARLMAPIGLLDRTPANLVHFALTDPRARTAYPDWEAIADARVASLGLSHRTDPHAGRLVDELTTLAATTFTDRANASPSPPARTGVESLRHPDAGELRLAFETLILPDTDNLQLTVYLPADESTSTRLDGLLRTGPIALPPLADDIATGSTGRFSGKHPRSTSRDPIDQ